jgi:hypothetical protein
MLAECPHCHKHTISRWRDAWRWNGYAPLICSNCHTPVKANQLLRAALTVVPMLITGWVGGPLIAHREPPLPSWVVAGIFAVSWFLGCILGYTISRYKEVKAKVDTPPAHMDR